MKQILISVLLMLCVSSDVFADVTIQAGQGGSIDKAGKAGNGGSLTLGHHWRSAVQTLPANGGTNTFIAGETPKHIKSLNPPPKWSALFKLADGRHVIEMKADCETQIFDTSVDYDCKSLAAFGAWLTSLNTAAVYGDGNLLRSGVTMVPNDGKYFISSPGKGGGPSAHDGDLEFIAGDFSLKFLYDGSVTIVRDGKSTRLVHPDADYVYLLFRHWLALSTANPSIELSSGNP